MNLSFVTLSALASVFANALAHPFSIALFGGLLIGIASLGVYVLLGRVAGISGIFETVLLIRPGGSSTWQLPFVIGLFVGGIVLLWLAPAQLGPAQPVLKSPASVAETLDYFALAQLMIAGLLVGIGTRMGGGCTSGHGVCGIGRASRRSIAATVTFMAVGMLTATFLPAIFSLVLSALGGEA